MMGGSTHRCAALSAALSLLLVCAELAKAQNGSSSTWAPKIPAAPTTKSDAVKIEPPSLPLLAVPAINASPVKAPSSHEISSQDANDAKIYCQNIADAAADARFAAQKVELARLESELNQRMELLDTKSREYRLWLQRRDDFIRRAEDSLVLLYTKVKPDAAAAQLAAMDEETASAILLKLNTRNASAIFDQMDAAKAARLVGIVVGALRTPDRASAQNTPPSKQAVATPPDASAKTEAQQ